MRLKENNILDIALSGLLLLPNLITFKYFGFFKLSPRFILGFQFVFFLYFWKDKTLLLTSKLGAVRNILLLLEPEIFNNLLCRSRTDVSLSAPMLNSPITLSFKDKIQASTTSET